MFLNKIIHKISSNKTILNDFILKINKLKVKEFIVKNNKRRIINFKNQIGGDIEDIIIKNNKYYYNIETGIGTDKTQGNHVLKLITIDGYDGCGTILYNSRNKVANITSVSSGKDCIFTEDKTIKYRIGDTRRPLGWCNIQYLYCIVDILMQIIIEICKNLKLKTIELTDNSVYPFTGEGVKLSIFRTITKGEPYYCKFNFINVIDNQIVKKNKLRYMEKQQLTVNEIETIIKEQIKESDNYYNDAINILKRISEKVKNNKIFVAGFLNYIFTKAQNEEIEIDKIRETSNKNLKKRKVPINKYSYIINRIMFSLYIKAGYKPLTSEMYVLSL